MLPKYIYSKFNSQSTFTKSLPPEHFYDYGYNDFSFNTTTNWVPLGKFYMRHALQARSASGRRCLHVHYKRCRLCAVITSIFCFL